MGHIQLLSRVPGRDLDAAIESGPLEFFHLSVDAVETDYYKNPASRTLSLGKGSSLPHFFDPVVSEAVWLHHNPPSSYYESLDENRRELARDRRLSYSTREEVAGVAEKLRIIRVEDELTEEVELRVLVRVVREFVLLECFYRIAALNEEAIIRQTS